MNPGAEETPPFDEKFLRLAFEEAHRALADGEVPVGCVFVYEEESGERSAIAFGRNTVNATKNATRHAEINCVDIVQQFVNEKKLDRKLFYRKIQVYVNVEPCIMCASALLQLQVGGIFFGCNNVRFGGCGSVLNVFEVATKKGNYRPHVEGGHRSDEAIELLKTFYKGENPNAPEDKRKPARL